MTRNEFEILMNEYGVPIEAAERFTVEESGEDWRTKYETLREEFENAKNTYLDKVFEKKETQDTKEEKEEETFSEKYIETIEREE